MANIKNIVDELSTIATAFTSVNSFNFGQLSDINTDREKSYPMVQLNSELTSNNIHTFTNYLPKEKTYAIDLVVWDIYKISERKTKDIQEKYSDIEIIADQYIAEILRRTVGLGGAFSLMNDEELAGTYVSNAHNDKLVGIKYSLSFRSSNVGCTLGTFSY
jgi:hypothetical protein